MMQNPRSQRDTVCNKVHTHEAIALYFSAPSCPVCHALRPKLLGAIRAEFPEIAIEIIDSGDSPDTAAHFGVFTVPTLLFFIQGKEIMRKSRYMRVGEVLDAIRRPYDMLRAA